MTPNFKKLFRLPSFFEVSGKRAGTTKELEDHRNALKADYPIRWAISDFLVSKYYWIYHRVNNAYWWVQYRVNPKHNYTTHKLTSLPPGYYDTNTLILHHSFDLFAKFMKFQLSDKAFVTWEYTEDCFSEWEVKEHPEETKKEIERRNAIWKEMKELYEWWTVTYPNQEDTLPDYPDFPKQWGSMAALNEDYDDTPEKEEWKRICDIRFKAEEQWKQEEIDNLIRLAKIQHSLWD